MAKVVEVIGVGNVEFPDSMSDEEILTTLRATPPPEPVQPSQVQQSTIPQGGNFLADIPSPEQVLQDPNSWRVSKGLAAATLGVKHGVEEAASQPITSPSRWMSPLTIPLTAALTGAVGAGIPPSVIQEGGKLVEALTPMMVPGWAGPAGKASGQFFKSKIFGEVDKLMKLRGIRPGALDLASPGVVPVGTKTASLDPIGEAVSRRLDQSSPELRPQLEETYNSLVKIHGPEKSAEMLFGPSVKSELTETAPLTMDQLVEVPAAKGSQVVITRPNYGQVKVITKDTPVATDLAAADVLLGEPQVVKGNNIDYGPIYDPARMGVERDRLVTIWDRVLRAAENLRNRLPADVSIAKQAPQSFVLHDIEKWQQQQGLFMKNLVENPWMGVIRGMDEKVIKDAEAQAVQVWEAGGKTPASYNLAISTMPKELQDYIRHRELRWATEDQARIRLGLEGLDHQEGPYIPRLVNHEFDEIFKIRQGGQSLAADVQQTIKRFANARKYSTQHEGEFNNFTYIPIRHAIIMREYEGMKLVETAKLMSDLEAHRVLYRDKASAALTGGGNAYEVTGLPGSSDQRWWAATKAEALFLQQNLSKADGLGLGSLNHWLNMTFRNINLLNPLPHFTKNMLYKYELAGGKVGFFGRNLSKDMYEYIYDTNPIRKAEFLQYMPHNDFGETASTIMQKMINDRGPIATIDKWVSALNKPSSNMLFGSLDPALRYSLWKQKVAKGMSPMEAANHVSVDLVRYGTRSDYVDFWKSIPMNFFVPWRVGSVTSVMKQLYERPIRTALKIGFLDYIREAIYRNTGQYFHMPIDYVTGPIVQTLTAAEESGPGTALGTAVGLAAVTRFAGPGGAWSAGQLANALGVLSQKDKVEWDRILNLWWGVSQLVTVPKAMFEAVSNPTPETIAGDLIKILGSVMIGSHEAYKYDPHRLGKYLPEFLPGMKKSRDFKLAELIRERFKQQSEKSQVKKEMRESVYGKPMERALRASGVIK